KSRFFQSALFFIAPTTIIVLTRALNGFQFLYGMIHFNNIARWDRYDVEYLIGHIYPVIYNSREIENFFTLSVALSALFLLPSIRNALCCSSKTAKAKVAPMDPVAAPSGHD
ncbi:hypothetical protein PFISCL1PPCAC_14763, partial [Pristionchus fissidentatus]